MTFDRLNPTTTTTLDDAFDRLGSSGFELPNGFVNHGPMACEALAALGCDDELDRWARRFARYGGTPVDPVVPRDFEWREALGDRGYLPEWIGFFQRAIEDDGWPSVVAAWVPRLLPGLAVALFHGAIRAAHAVRAIDESDTSPRRAELARALGYWASRFTPGAPVVRVDVGEDLRLAIIGAAADGARHYLAHPGIVELHGVTGAMAVELFAPHMPADAVASGLAQVLAEHNRLYRSTRPVDAPAPVGVRQAELVRAAVTSQDPHQVKLVEACLRGAVATGNPAFAAAAQRVTGTSVTT
ncbi:MAG: questin oxidase family protein [Actinomycetota bacterium]|nr:questin oxidase family protein [Actinomycetota bacterium]